MVISSRRSSGSERPVSFRQWVDHDHDRPPQTQTPSTESKKNWKCAVRPACGFRRPASYYWSTFTLQIEWHWTAGGLEESHVPWTHHTHLLLFVWAVEFASASWSGVYNIFINYTRLSSPLHQINHHNHSVICTWITWFLISKLHVEQQNAAIKLQQQKGCLKNSN